MRSLYLILFVFFLKKEQMQKVMWICWFFIWVGRGGGIFESMKAGRIYQNEFELRSACVMLGQLFFD